HGYDTFPKTADRLAPVAAGTFEGLRFQVSNASTAKATASLASEGMPNSSEERSRRPSAPASFAKLAINVRFLAPPPEAISSEKLPWGSTYRRTASAIERVVITVAVRIRSAFSTGALLRLEALAEPVLAWRQNLSANSRPNSSRPAVFGGFRRKKLSRRKSETGPSSTRPAAAILPSRS